MSLGNDKSLFDESHDRDWTPIVLATIASIVIHLFLYFRVSDMRFDVTAQIPEKLRETPVRKIVNFEHVRQDPVKSYKDIKSGSPEGAAPGPMHADEMAQIFDQPAITFSAPPAQPEAVEAATFKETPLSEIAPEAPVWQPRQEVIGIVDRIVRDDIALLPRRELFDIERVAKAPDYAPAVPLSGATVQVPMDAPKEARSLRLPAEEPAMPEPVVPAVAETVVTAAEATPAATLEAFSETPNEISEYRHVDDRLSVYLRVFQPAGNDPRKYFRLEIVPSPSAQLPIVGKDIVFVQDASRSLARERLHFCKEGLKEALGTVSAADRFNVVSFRDNATFCFGLDWALPTTENFQHAIAFIDSLDSRGDTDLFRSLKSLTALPRDPARPLIAIVITDGKATTGITASTRIIGEFSKLNDDMSLYVLGTHAKANAYLLDMLAFCNRGRQDVVRSDRWSIPGAVKELVESCSQPLLGRVKIESDIASGAEFFPLPSANLYAGEPLVYYGSCPRQTREMTLQVRGEGGNAKIDCMFGLDFSRAMAGGPEVKSEWARRKMHSLIGDYARSPSDAKKAEMRALGATTGEPIPYFGEL